MTENILHEFDSFLLDSTSRKLFQDGTLAHLTPKAFEMLLVMARSQGQTLTKDQLVKSVWPGTYVTDNNFAVTLRAVRKALGESGSEPKYIVKVPDGYRFVAEVREIKVTNSTAVLASPADASESSGTEYPSHDLEAASPIMDVVAEANIAEPGVLPPDPSLGMESEPDSDVPRADKRSSFEKLAEVGTPTSLIRAYRWHLVISCTLYSLLYVEALVLEVSFKFDQLGEQALRLTPLVFLWIIGTSLFVLVGDWKITMKGTYSSLPFIVLTFIAAALLLQGALSFFLPGVPITEAASQSQPAQGAYFKNVVIYFIPLGLVFMVLPFHFVASLQRQMARRTFSDVLALLLDKRPAAAPKDAFYIKEKTLGSLLFGAGVVCLLLTFRLFDNLKPGPYLNLFSHLAIWRIVLYFGLGLECVLWYSRTLNEIKRECLDQMRAS